MNAIVRPSGATARPVGWFLPQVQSTTARVSVSMQEIVPKAGPFFV